MTYARMYDCLVRFYPGEQAFYRKFAQENLPRNHSILVAPCATGWLALALSGAGYQTTGVDLDPEMIELAQEKLSRFTVNTRNTRLRKHRDREVVFEADNMLDFGREQSFDCVIVPQRGILCLNAQARAKAFVHFAQILRPNGFLVFDFSENQTAPLFRYRYRFSGLQVAEQVETINDSAGSRVRQILTIQSQRVTVLSQKFEPRTYPIKLDLWYPKTSEIRKLIGVNGFSALAHYGNFFGVAHQKNSGYQLWVCQKLNGKRQKQ